MKTDHLNVAVAFGNDGYEQDPRSQLEVARFRDVLQSLGVAEVGFGLDSQERYTWALLFVPGAAPLEFYEQLLWAAWTGEGEGRGSSVSSAFRSVQKAIATRSIAENEPKPGISGN